MKRYILIILVSACVALAQHISAASAEPLWNKPVYDPASKAYIEMVRINTTQYSHRHDYDTDWGYAEKMAAARTYKGAKGRLVVVKTLEMHEFLERTFQPDTYIWIGLRWWCSDHSLEFTDGSRWQNGTFQAWDAKWDQSDLADPCWKWHSYKTPSFMPVAYTPLAKGFRWFATGESKDYYGYFVEYPTGAP